MKITLSGRFADVNAKTILQKRGLLPGGMTQMFIASEVIRRMDPYTPMETGTLKSAPRTIDGTEIVQSTPYACRHYYNVGGVDSLGRHYGPATFQGAPMRGSHWFERMKNEGGKEAIGEGAAKLAGGRYEA